MEKKEINEWASTKYVPAPSDSQACYKTADMMLGESVLTYQASDEEDFDMQQPGL